MAVAKERANPLITRLEEEAKNRVRIEAGTALAPEIYARMRELFASKFPDEASERRQQKRASLPTTRVEDDGLSEEDISRIEAGLVQMLRESRLDGASIKLITQRLVVGVGEVDIEIVLKKSGDKFRLRLSLADRQPESIFVISQNQLLEESIAVDSDIPNDPMQQRFGHKYRTWPKWRRGVDVEDARGILAIVEQLSQSETENAWKLGPGDRSTKTRH